jgi:hypothetical protein
MTFFSDRLHLYCYMASKLGYRKRLVLHLMELEMDLTPTDTHCVVYILSRPNRVYVFQEVIRFKNGISVPSIHRLVWLIYLTFGHEVESCAPQQSCAESNPVIEELLRYHMI